jgi:predicted transcriptional regulator
MNIQAEKLDIIQWLAGVNDSKVIRQFMLLKQSSEEAAGADLIFTEAEKKAIDEGLASIEAGRFKTHEDVMAATRKRYPHLFK